MSDTKNMDAYAEIKTEKAKNGEYWHYPPDDFVKRLPISS
jgi:hypothetical protein